MASQLAIEATEENARPLAGNAARLSERKERLPGSWASANHYSRVVDQSIDDLVLFIRQTQEFFPNYSHLRSQRRFKVKIGSNLLPDSLADVRW
jgi:hypothetical protein